MTLRIVISRWLVLGSAVLFSSLVWAFVRARAREKERERERERD